MIEATPIQKLVKAITEGKIAKAKQAQERAQKKFWATHALEQVYNPTNPTGKFIKDEEGKMIPEMKPAQHYVDVKDEETGKIEQKLQNVMVVVTRFVGWNYHQKDKYTGAALRALRKKQTDAAIGDQTVYADGTPILRPTHV